MKLRRDGNAIGNRAHLLGWAFVFITGDLQTARYQAIEATHCSNGRPHGHAHMVIFEERTFDNSARRVENECVELGPEAVAARLPHRTLHFSVVQPSPRYILHIDRSRLELVAAVMVSTSAFGTAGHFCI